MCVVEGRNMNVSFASDPVIDTDCSNALVIGFFRANIGTYIIMATMGHMKHRYELRKVRKDEAE